MSEEFRRMQLKEMVKNVHALTATHLRHLKVAFDFRPEPQLPTIFGMPDQLQQVILNLFMNAAEAMPEGGQLRVSTSRVPEKDEILLSVSDTGTGIDLTLLPGIFDPFVTSKESGTGLGLSISHSIVERHSGRIQAVNNPDRATTPTLLLPIQPHHSQYS